MTALPLNGVKVLDFTGVQAGPACTQLMAWFGRNPARLRETARGIGSLTQHSASKRNQAFAAEHFSASQREGVVRMSTRPAPCIETPPCPDCGTVHDYNCRRYVVVSIAAAVWVTLLLLILVAALSDLIR